MLYLIISQLIIIPLLFGWGKLFSKIIKPLWNGNSAYLILGVVSISISASLFGFFFALDTFWESIIITVGLIGLLIYKTDFFEFIKSFKNKQLLLLIFTGIAISTFAPYINDHFGYYAGTIKWLDEYGIVKGISNISLVLGQQSSWHIFQASFNQILDPYLRINLIPYSIFVLYIFEKKHWNLLLFIPLFFLFLHSPSPDLPVYIFSIIIVVEFFKNDFLQNYTWLWLLSVFIFTVKPTAFWLPLFIFLAGTKVEFQSLFKIKTLLATFILLFVFFAKQIWTFGDILFPAHSGLIDVSWKPSAFLMDLSYKNAIQKTYDFQYSVAEIQSWDSTTRIIKWFTLDGFKKIIHLAIATILIGFGVFSFIKKSKMLILLWSCITLKTIFVFYFSGQYRFIIDAVLALLALVVLSISIKPNILKLLTFSGCILLFLNFLFPQILQQNIKSFYLGHLMGKPEVKQLIEPLSYHISDYDNHQIGNIKFYTPKKYHLMHDAPLPCFSPYTINEFFYGEIYPEPYDKNNLGKGFYIRKITPEEKKQLDSIRKKNTVLPILE